MNSYSGIYRGKVLGTDVNETDKIGRIKVEVYPMLISSDETNGSAARLVKEGFDIEGITLDAMPWAVPAMSLFSGSGNSYGSFTVPDVGSFVWVFFENGDIYQPVYFAEACTQTYGIPTEALTGYPYRKVWKTKNGIIIEIDDTDGAEVFKVTHPAGTIINIDSNGNISITSAGTTTITSTGILSVTAPEIHLN